MHGNSLRVDRELLRKRIRDGIFRERGSIVRLGSAPLPLSPATLEGQSEAGQLEWDLANMHDLHLLEVGAGAPRQPLLRPLVALLRRTAQAVLRPMLAHQSEFNGATARAVTMLRNQAMLHERMLNDCMREIERTAQGLERRLSPLDTRMADLDQLALANDFRETEDSVKARQRLYVSRFAGCGEVVDLCCGRGEFLELVREANVKARGIELDNQMIEHCRAKGLAVEQRDALEYLAGLPDGSAGGFFAAQLIERLPAVDLVRLVREARRALEPGGVLLVESVNPESLLSFAEFYADPMHVRPYHPQVVRWLFEHEGFVDVEVELSGDPEPDQPLPPLATAGIEAPAFDYAVSRLNTLVYGPRAYSVAGVTPPVQP